LRSVTPRYARNTAQNFLQNTILYDIIKIKTVTEMKKNKFFKKLCGKKMTPEQAILFLVVG